MRNVILLIIGDMKMCYACKRTYRSADYLIGNIGSTSVVNRIYRYTHDFDAIPSEGGVFHNISI